MNQTAAEFTAGDMEGLLSGIGQMDTDTLSRIRTLYRPHDAVRRDPGRAMLTFGLPWLEPGLNCDWLGPRLVWWPQGIPDFRRVSVVSSRIGTRPDREHRWFELLRTAVINLDPESDGLVVAESTASAPYILRAGELYNLPTLLFRLPKPRPTQNSVSSWLHELLTMTISSDDVGSLSDIGESLSPRRVEAFLSPQLDLSSPREHPQSDQSATHQTAPPGAEEPLADRCLFTAADRIIVLRCRRGGTVASLCTRHLRDHRRNDSWLLAAVDDDESCARFEELEAGRFVRWVAEAKASAVACHDSDSEKGSVSEIVTEDGPLQDPSAWLCHWTRARTGPWPDQLEQEWLDELILGRDSADRSAMSALMRIHRHRVVRGSSQWIRGDQPVVSLTAVPLHEFRQRRIYRRHRRTVDFELFGVAVRRARWSDVEHSPSSMATNSPGSS